MRTPDRKSRPARARTSPGGPRPRATEGQDEARARPPAKRRGPAARGGGRPDAKRGRPTLKRPGIAAPEIARILDRQPWAMLEAPIAAAGIDPAPVMDRLRGYARLLIHWNRSVSNLLSKNDERRFVERHLCESLAPLGTMAAGGIERWLDIGSGGGLPAVPLALAGLGRHWTLVESRRMKTLFLLKVKQELALDSIDVICARIEKLEPSEPVMGVTSRATLSLTPTLSEASRFVATDGKAFLWKGERRLAEMGPGAAWRADWTEDATIELPETPTVVVTFTRK